MRFEHRISDAEGNRSIDCISTNVPFKRVRIPIRFLTWAEHRRPCEMQCLNADLNSCTSLDKRELISPALLKEIPALLTFSRTRAK